MEICYEYDGSFAGFLTCVFTSFAEHEFPFSIISSRNESPGLFSCRYIATNFSYAQRVYGKLKKIAPRAAYLVSRGFLCDLPQREICLLNLIRFILQEGSAALTSLTAPAVYPVWTAVRRLEKECQLLRGFIRFSEFDGMLAGEIQPKNHVLPILCNHFCQRFQNEQFLLYDRTHHEALFYAKGHHQISHLEEFHMAAASTEEIQYRQMWRKFYDTIAIAQRYNPKCRQTHMPKRYWACMTEFQREDFFTPHPAENGAVYLSPDVPAEKSEPVIPAVCGPSVPASIP